MPQCISSFHFYFNCIFPIRTGAPISTATSDIADKVIVTANQNSRIWLITIIVAAVIFMIIVIVFIVFLVRGLTKKREGATSTDLSTVAAAVPPAATSPADVQTRPPFISQIRRSLSKNQKSAAKVKETENQNSEEYQVPSMYPPLPSAPEWSGVDNPEFKADE